MLCKLNSALFFCSRQRRYALKERVIGETNFQQKWPKHHPVSSLTNISISSFTYRGKRSPCSDLICNRKCKLAILDCTFGMSSCSEFTRAEALHYYSPWRVIRTVKVKLFCGQCNLCEDLSVFQQNIPQGFYFSFTRNTHLNISSAFWQVILTWPFISRPNFHSLTHCSEWWNRIFFSRFWIFFAR